MTTSRWGHLVPLIFLSAFSLAQRLPVLKQIDLPHPYYFREMYLPQLTTGPSAAAWTPDSRALIYSMGGSLWKQGFGATSAEELTEGPGYDYQPDCSPDGRWVVFVRYDHEAIELWALDLRTGAASQLTSAGEVNLEPRFSPDGKQLAFVSTSYKGHFHIFLANFNAGTLSNIRQLTSEHVSDLPRYYYSKVDHEISPVWSRDGTEILFVSNRGHIHGTGGFWRMKAVPGAEMHEIHYEETTWKARPDFSPDGKRMVYASYLGRQWHQLWVMPGTGGDAFPISYGEYDNINSRWSPDGWKIAFISNRDGNTSLWVQTIPGGAQTEIVARDRRYLRPGGKLMLRVSDASGKPRAARVFLTAADGRTYAPDDAWIMADDSFDRKERAFEAHYFNTDGLCEVTVPAGEIKIGVMSGFERRFEEATVQVAADKVKEIKIVLHPIGWKSGGRRWVSGDVHVHMNYAGTYRNTPAHLMQQAAAENVSVVENLVVNKEQRFPDEAYFSAKADPASDADHLLLHGQEFHTSYWGHLGLLNLDNLILPGYSGYPNTAAASLFPSNANVADMAHAQANDCDGESCGAGALAREGSSGSRTGRPRHTILGHTLVGYVHPLDSVPDLAKDDVTYELPADVALGKIDYIEVLGFSDHKSTAEVWYKLLNCGFHLPSAAGTDFMGNYASLRGPIGLNRVYAEVPAGALDSDQWLDSIKAGRTFATNGPLLRFQLEDQSPGGEVHLAKSGEVKFSASLGSIVPLEHLQIICNGKLVRELELDPSKTTAYVEGQVPLERSGWCLLRAFSDKAAYPILDAYPYATTSPIYVSVADTPWHSREDAAYFAAWMERLISATEKSTDWNSKEERQTVKDLFSKAKKDFSDFAK